MQLHQEMGADRNIVRLCHMGNFHPRRDAPDACNVDLHDAGRACHQVVLELTDGIHAFANRNRDRGARRQAAVRQHIVRGQGFFKPSDVQWFEHLCAASGLGEGEALG